MTNTNFLSEITGSFATPAAENPTVAIIESSFKATGFQGRYINCNVTSEELQAAVNGAVAQGWLGFNCSIPHKVAILPMLDDLSESARLIGAVNCVTIEHGRLLGENTDGKGFLESIRKIADPAGKNLVIFGAGGAARAISVELALAGVKEITIVNRDKDRGTQLCDHLNQHTPARAAYVEWHTSFRIPESTDFVVNATSIGMFPAVDEHPDVVVSSLLPSMIVADVVTNPPQTRFLREAERVGCTTIDGHGMLIEQAAAAIALWTHKSAEKNAMRQTLQALFPDTMTK